MPVNLSLLMPGSPYFPPGGHKRAPFHRWATEAVQPDPWLFLLLLFLFCVRAVIIRVIWHYMAGDWLARRKRTCFSAAFWMQSNLIVSQFSDMFGEVKSMPSSWLKKKKKPAFNSVFISLFCYFECTVEAWALLHLARLFLSRLRLRCVPSFFPPKSFVCITHLALKGKSSTRFFFLHKLCPLACQAFEAQLHGKWNEGRKKEEEKVWTNYKVENCTKACVRRKRFDWGRKRHESYGACECHAALTSMGDCGSAGQAAVSAYRKHQIREDN